MAPVKFTYFPLFAKGPACALALEFSGMEWEGANQGEWPKLKPTTPWRELPILEVPELGTIGHELAILNYIAKQVPAMGGATEKDYVVSQQLMHEAEDIYAKLGKIQDTLYAKDKVPKEEVEAFWSSTDQTGHNRGFGVHVFLTLLEEFYVKASAGDGKFTTSGTTIGECKLWATLHMLKMIRGDVLDKYSGLVKFYDRFGSEAKTQDIVKTGGKMPAPFAQYFIA